MAWVAFAIPEVDLCLAFLGARMPLARQTSEVVAFPMALSTHARIRSAVASCVCPWRQGPIEDAARWVVTSPLAMERLEALQVHSEVVDSARYNDTPDQPVGYEETVFLAVGGLVCYSVFSELPTRSGHCSGCTHTARPYHCAAFAHQA
jgi:hypothetical protein